ncbi:hypothetical protein DM860_011425 [Cuscuta australis]|uniref:Thiol-disulfide oxidoreductase DCC n=1 Tax=Cuscuta australis TaxID=267555 RepID=A0A328DRF7_9ASTE|nr:hypothetical protein DM860_011425 [Cuscuta australis]
MLRIGVRNLVSLWKSPNSFLGVISPPASNPRIVVETVRPLTFRCFSAKPFASSPASNPRIMAPSTAAGLVEDLLFDDDVCTVPKTDTIPTPLQPGVVVYDGVCHLCHKGVKWVIKVDKDRKIKFCCLQSKAAEPYMSLCGVDRNDVERRFLFIEGPGLYHQGSTAALKVLYHLPFPYSVLSAFMVIPKPLRDAVYDYVAKRHYHWFGKDNDCLVLQEKELLDRFIDAEELLRRNQSAL